MSARRSESLRPPVFGSPAGLLVVAAAVLMILAPVGEGPSSVLLVPHLVLVPLFYFTLRPVEGIGPVGAFAAGLSVDVLTYGPLGVTAAVMLAVHFVLRREREALMTLPAVFRLTGFALAVGFVLTVSSFSMAVLGPRGWPGPVEITMGFAGLLTLALCVELARAGFGLRGARNRFGGQVRRKKRRKPKLRRPPGNIARTMGRNRRKPGSRPGFSVLRRGRTSRRGLVGRKP